MELRTIIFGFGVFLIASSPSAYAEPGGGISSGQISFTYVTDRHCYGHAECLQFCQKQAQNKDAIVGAKCVKFAGNFYHDCCCYGSLTNACCQNGYSGLDCHVSGPEIKAARYQ